MTCICTDVYVQGFCSCLLLAGNGGQKQCILMVSLLLVSISMCEGFHCQTECAAQVSVNIGRSLCQNMYAQMVFCLLATRVGQLWQVFEYNPITLFLVLLRSRYVGHKLMEPPSMVLLGLLLVYGLACCVQQTQGSPSDSSHGSDRTQEFESSDDGLEKEFLYAGRSKRAPADQQQDKCSYTFIVPQQKVTGAICVNSKEPEAMLENRVNKQELELLNVELQKQKRQIETLQQLVEVDGGIVNEVKLLRKESRNMNSRVTQLYMQLLHEIIRKRDNALELAQMENKILNQTSEMQQLTSRYKDLEHKYQHLASLATNQSTLIALLEEQCQSRPPPRHVPVPQPRPQPPPPSPPLSKPYQPPVLPRINNPISNEIQSDQKSPPVLPTMPTGTHSPSTTDKPSGESNKVQRKLLNKVLLMIHSYQNHLLPSQTKDCVSEPTTIVNLLIINHATMASTHSPNNSWFKYTPHIPRAKGSWREQKCCCLQPFKMHII